MDGSPSTRLKRSRISAGFKTRQAFVDAHKLARSAYYSHESGGRGIPVGKAEEYATLLGNCSAGWILTGEGLSPGLDANVAPAKMGRATVVGAVQAGDWREAFDWDIEDQYQIMTPVNGFHETDLFALEVRGSSVDRVYPDGSILVCVTLPALGREPMDEELVVCQRVDDAGFWEATCKRIRTGEDGTRWLWPESNDPMHQEPISMKSENGEMVALRGVVIYGIKNELRT